MTYDRLRRNVTVNWVQTVERSATFAVPASATDADVLNYFSDNKRAHDEEHHFIETGEQGSDYFIEASNVSTIADADLYDKWSRTNV